MSDGTLECLRLRRRGRSLEELYEKGADRKQKKIDDQVRAATDTLVHKQTTFQQEAGSLIGQIVALDVVQPGQDAVQALKEQVAQLRVIQEQLQGALTVKQKQLDTRRSDVAHLSEGLQSLAESLRQVPPAAFPTADIITFGDKLTTYMSEK